MQLMNEKTRSGIKFSIIIPIYNVAPYLRGCLDSVCESADRVGGVEVICVDDGSPDNSGEILDEYREKVSKLQGFKVSGEESFKVPAFQGFKVSGEVGFKVIHQKNAGVSAARNRGIEEARGEWILFVDGDDQMMPETLSFLADAVKDADFDLLQYGCAEVDAQDAKVPYVPCPIARYAMEGDDGVARAYRATRNLLVWNGCFRRSLIGDVRFKKMHPGEDSLFADEMFVRARCVAVTDTVLYRYLQRAESVMHVQRLSPVLSAIQSLRLRYDLLTHWNRYGAIRSGVKKLCLTTSGQIAERMRGLQGEDLKSAWLAFIDTGCVIFAGSFPYRLAFYLESKWLINLLIYRQFVLRKTVARLRRRFK